MDAQRIAYGKDDAAAQIGVSKSKIEELMRKGEIGYAKVGTRVVIHRDELDRFVRERTVRTANGTTTGRFTEGG